MKKQLQYIDLMQDDLQRSAKRLMRDMQERRVLYSDRDHGKTIVLGKITALRRELLNLAKRIEEETR